MKEKSITPLKLKYAILSLSLLTVMAGAAVAPALDVIGAHFADAPAALVQMIVSMPALFIIITNLLFSRLCRYLPSRTLALLGLGFYIAGGCLAGAFDHIGLVLAARSLVGVGVGLLMPLSTGLLAFYFAPAQQEGLMGLSSAVNQLGGVIATLLAGALSTLSWRASFLVYLLGVPSLLLCLRLPNEQLRQHKSEADLGAVFSRYRRYIALIFLLMLSFFIYPTNFALETAADGVIARRYIAVIMALTDLVALAGGLAFVLIKKRCGQQTRLIAPLLFFCGYLALALNNSWAGVLLGSAGVGFATGLGVPFIISAASAQAGRSAATTVLPLLSAALYLAQFVTPALTAALSTLLPAQLAHPAYWVAAAASAALLLCSLGLHPGAKRAATRLAASSGQA